jgi:hypothetical protein
MPRWIRWSVRNDVGSAGIGEGTYSHGCGVHNFCIRVA